MIKVGVTGACGKMGKEVVQAVLDSKELELVCAVDLVNEGEDIGEIVTSKPCNVKIFSNLDVAISITKPDVMVDFTQPKVIFENAKIMLNNCVRPIIGTTGLTTEQIAELKKISQDTNTGCFIAPNFTTGAVLMMMFSKMAAKYFDNAEIIELHHNQKKDAPSGTAVKTAEMMSEAKADFAKNNCAETELITGSRGGKTVSNIHIHSVRMPGYIASQEVIFGASGQVFKIRHDSMDRTCYMDGVIMAIKHVVNNNDFVYGLDNIL